MAHVVPTTEIHRKKQNESHTTGAPKVQAAPLQRGRGVRSARTFEPRECTHNARLNGNDGHQAGALRHTLRQPIGHAHACRRGIGSPPGASWPGACKDVVSSYPPAQTGHCAKARRNDSCDMPQQVARLIHTTVPTRYPTDPPKRIWGCSRSGKRNAYRPRTSLCHPPAQSRKAPGGVATG